MTSRRLPVVLVIATVVALVLSAAPGAIAAQSPVFRCTIVGTSGDDMLNGTPGPDVMCGLAGNDTIRGLAGNDVLIGGNGADRLHGGDGDDDLRGDKQDTVLNGDAGDDTGANTTEPNLIVLPLSVRWELLGAAKQLRATYHHDGECSRFPANPMLLASKVWDDTLFRVNQYGVCPSRRASALYLMFNIDGEKIGEVSFLAQEPGSMVYDVTCSGPRIFCNVSQVKPGRVVLSTTVL